MTKITKKTKNNKNNPSVGVSINDTAEEISITLSNAEHSITWSGSRFEWVAKELILENIPTVPNNNITWYNLDSYLPDTVNTYEVMVYASLNLSTTVGSNLDVLAVSDIFLQSIIPIIRASRQAGSSSAIYASTVIIPVIGRIGVQSLNLGGGRVVGLKGYKRIS